jgi:microcystin-dependent protein
VQPFGGQGSSNTDQPCYLAEVRLSAAAYPPNGFSAADGQILSINENQDLFTLLGTKYGGDGQSTFALPDLRDLAPGDVNYVICTSGIFPTST